LLIAYFCFPISLVIAAISSGFFSRPRAAQSAPTPAGRGLRGGMVFRAHTIKFPQKTLRAWSYELPDGKLQQFMVAAVE